MNLSRLTCAHLQHMVQFCSEILHVQTPLFNFSVPSMSYSCYGDISALQAPMISCTAVRAPDCGMYHSFLDLSNCLYLTGRCFTFHYRQIKWGAAIQLAKREKATPPPPKWQVLRSLQTWWEAARRNLRSHSQDPQPKGNGTTPFQSKWLFHQPGL